MLPQLVLPPHASFSPETTMQVCTLSSQTSLCVPIRQEFTMSSFLLNHPVEGTVRLFSPLICKLHLFDLQKSKCPECHLPNAE